MKRLAPLWVLLTLSAVPCASEEARLLSSQPAGRLALEDESHIGIQGWRGDLVLREVDGKEIDYGCTEGRSGRACPVELWTAGRALVFRPPEGPVDPRSLDLGIPAGLDVEIAASDCRISARSLSGRIDARGERLDVELAASRGEVDLNIASGSVSLEDPMRAVRLEGSDLAVRVLRGVGELRINLVSSDAEFEGFGGPLKGDLRRVALRIRGGEGDIELRGAGGGPISLGQRTGAARFELAGVALEVENARGPLDVTSDGRVLVRNLEGDATVRGRIPELSVSQLNGSLAAVLEAAARIDVADVHGPVRIEADDLQARLTRIVGDLTLSAERGGLDVEWPTGTVTLRNGWGETHVRHTQERLSIDQQGGSVRCEEILGPVDVRASAEEVRVEWSGLSGTWDSTIENTEGPVSVLFPAGSRFVLQARSEYGRVESSLPRMSSGDDGGSVSGVVGGPGGPKIMIRASDTITLALAGSS